MQAAPRRDCDPGQGGCLWLRAIPDGDQAELSIANAWEPLWE